MKKESAKNSFLENFLSFQSTYLQLLQFSIGLDTLPVKSIRRKVLCKKAILKNFEKLTKKQPRCTFFRERLQARLSNLLKNVSIVGIFFSYTFRNRYPEEPHWMATASIWQKLI